MFDRALAGIPHQPSTISIEEFRDRQERVLSRLSHSDILILQRAWIRAPPVGSHLFCAVCVSFLVSDRRSGLAIRAGGLPGRG